MNYPQRLAIAGLTGTIYGSAVVNAVALYAFIVRHNQEAGATLLIFVPILLLSALIREFVDWEPK